MNPAAAAGGGRGRPAAKARRSPGGKRRTRGRGRPRRVAAPLSRLRVGEAIALAAAILLFVLMFFDWFGIKSTAGAESFAGVVGGTGGGDAWQTLEVIPLFLMLAIAVAVGAAILRLSCSDWKPAIPPAAAVCVLGLLAALLILIRILAPPGPPGELSELAFESTLKLPIFLALAAALGIAYGGRRAMAEEGTSFAAIAKKLESPSRTRRGP
ncbi:MAG: hypothetical protein JSU06_11145 [Actinobacteria bacterium]|nr:hypothetical protein [Actinomycetota bacterium]